MSSGLFKNNVTNKLFSFKSYTLYKQDLAFDNTQELMELILEKKKKKNSDCQPSLLWLKNLND